MNADFIRKGRKDYNETCNESHQNGKIVFASLILLRFVLLIYFKKEERTGFKDWFFLLISSPASAISDRIWLFSCFS